MSGLLVLNENGELSKVINVSSISFVERDGEGSLIHVLSGESIPSTCSISKLLELLQDAFEED